MAFRLTGRSFSLLLMCGIGVVGVACSASTVTPETPGDSGTPQDAADAGAPTGGDDAGDAVEDSAPPRADAGRGSPDATVAREGGGPLACPPGPTQGYTATPYVAAVAHQGLCTPAEVATFVAECVNSADAGDCTTWQNENVADQVPGASGTACGNCIFPANNNGGAWSDPEDYFAPNYAGCIQLLDKVHGAACAAAFNNASSCESVACDYCPGNGVNDVQDCVEAADQGSCKPFWTVEQSACKTDFADGGAYGICSSGDTYTYVIDLICGGAIADAGKG